MGYTSSYASKREAAAAREHQESTDGATGVAHLIAFIVFAWFCSWLLGPAVMGVVEGITFSFLAVTLGLYVALVAGIKAGIRHLHKRNGPRSRGLGGA
jgi:cobalamin biosynthesis protein CobD/CbiB